MVKREKKAKPEYNFSELMSPTSWLIFFGLAFFLEILILRPRWDEYLVYFVVENLMVIPTQAIHSRILNRAAKKRGAPYPCFENYDLEKLNSNQQSEFVRWLFEFPKIQAISATALSFFKGIPGTCLILFYWTYEHSLFEQLALSVTITLFLFAFFSIAVYVEAHRHASEVLGKVVSKFHWAHSLTQTKRDLNSECFIL